MIKLERTSVMNLENAMRGARNPMNSWGRMDSGYDADGSYRLLAECNGYVIDYDILVYVGDGMYTDRWGFLCTVENGTLSFVADGMHVYSRVG